MVDKSNFTEKSFSNIIDLIYDSASDPDLWPQLLNVMHQNMHSNDLDSSPPSNLSMLESHFDRALSLTTKTDSLQSENTAISAILDYFPIGVLLINSNMHIVATNQYARSTVEDESILEIQDGKLKATTPDTHGKLSDMISRSTLAKEDLDVLDSPTLSIHNKAGHAFSMWAESSSRINLANNLSLTAIFIIKAKTKHNISDRILAPYHLTSAETRLLNQLINNSHTLSEAADYLDLSKHTVRTQMKMILKKTNTHSQAELLKKILSNPSFLFNSPDDNHSPLPDVQNTHKASLSLTKKTSSKSAGLCLSLPDGRQLEYSEFGDPNGTPVLFFHGIVHSKTRYHPSSLYAEEHGIRIIAPERPGFSKSDAQTKRSLTAYIGDIKQLMTSLHIHAFYVASDGDGGAAALATTCLMPKQVLKTAIIGCMPEPRFEALEHILPFDKKLQSMALSSPKIIIYGLCRIILKAVKIRNHYFELMYGDFAETDLAVVKSTHHKKIFAEAMDNINKHNVNGFIDDYFCRLYPWDFRIENIQGQVDMWHGHHDPFSNIASAKKIEQALNNCQPHYLEDQGHYLFMTHWDEILKTLTIKH